MSYKGRCRDVYEDGVCALGERLFLRNGSVRCDCDEVGVKNFISAEEQRRAQLESAASTHTTPAPLDSLGLPESTVMRRRGASSSLLYEYQENVL